MGFLMICWDLWDSWDGWGMVEKSTCRESQWISLEIKRIYQINLTGCLGLAENGVWARPFLMLIMRIMELELGVPYLRTNPYETHPQSLVIYCRCCIIDWNHLVIYWDSKRVAPQDYILLESSRYRVQMKTRGQENVVYIFILPISRDLRCWNHPNLWSDMNLMIGWYDHQGSLTLFRPVGRSKQFQRLKLYRSP